MSMTLPAPAARQPAVVAAILVLHVGAFVAATTGLPVRIDRVPVFPHAIFMMPPPDEPLAVVRPERVEVGDYQPEQAEMPRLLFAADDGEAIGADAVEMSAVNAANGTTVPSGDDRGPTVRTRDARLQALVDGCYPASSRRHGEEGRGIVRIVVDASGRANAWGIESSTGFEALDAGMGCVARKIEFEPARRDGRAVEAPVRMPIIFRLR